MTQREGAVNVFINFLKKLGHYLISVLVFLKNWFLNSRWYSKLFVFVFLFFAIPWTLSFILFYTRYALPAESNFSLFGHSMLYMKADNLYLGTFDINNKLQENFIKKFNGNYFTNKLEDSYVDSLIFENRIFVVSYTDNKYNLSEFKNNNLYVLNSNFEIKKNSEGQILEVRKNIECFVDKNKCNNDDRIGNLIDLNTINYFDLLGWCEYRDFLFRIPCFGWFETQVKNTSSGKNIYNIGDIFWIKYNDYISYLINILSDSENSDLTAIYIMKDNSFFTTEKTDYIYI